ncbi:hypothetical protein C8F04DRAFT_1062785 [Mycena alexandri]|uniref:TERF2-interacting telomeric protein 1 Myb domain-containing protein n=1 Tax=Mycena alexandri TaxID=1745969 RepID=A0AAD6TNM1_9AGAR|nr:hypothetical protein C8F04DRAFT_1062785 [Mycena alexandri]
MQEEEEEFNDQLFVNEHGEPLKFYLHTSIKQPGARAALETKIEVHGGETVPTDAGSHVILVNPNHPSGDRDGIRHAYKTHSDPQLRRVYVEGMKWVDNCISNGKCTHYYIQKGMGGAVGYKARTSFTEEDDEHLAYYLAILIPYKSDGGRTGNNIYKLLMKNTDNLPLEYDWALRHTWQSWRQRYKTKQEWFDARITELAERIKPAPHQRYHLSRNAVHRSARREEEEEEEEEVEVEEEEDQIEDEDEDEYVSATAQKRRISGPGSAQPAAKRIRIDPPVAQDKRHSSSKGKEKENAPPDDLENVYPDEDDGDGGSLFSSPHHPTQATLVGTAPSEIVAQETLVEPAVSEPPQPTPRPKRSAARPINPRSVPPMPTPRSTRARSETLEPYVDDVQAIGRKNRQKGKQKALEPVEEGLEDIVSRHSISREPEGTAETQEVEAFLTAHSGISDGGNIVEEDEGVEEVEMPPPRDIRRPARPSSPLETDDGQTDTALRRNRQVSFSPVAPSATEILRNLGRPRLSRAPENVAAYSSRRDVFESTSSRRGSSVQIPTIDFQNNLFYTPGARRGTTVSRSDSDSSASLFPMGGTRARSVKDKIKKQEKHTPYSPPTGTRAGDIVNTR